MAEKVRLTWKLENGSELVCGVNGGTKEKPSFDFLFRADLRKLFPSFTELTVGQRFAIQYGVKQKLSDALAPPEIETVADKKATLKSTWEEWLSGKLFEKKASTRTAFDLGAAVRALRAQGLKDEVIAMALQKPLALVSAVAKE